ncbi:MAG: thiamine-phosphate kinase [Verrucomicrobiota bacterium]|nr:thiamine-phosphate kinase [Verrucomicrobiota bacterium]
MKLRELGEDRLLNKLLPSLPIGHDVILGPGDDCAVLRGDTVDKVLLLKTDCVVERVHFTAETRPSAIGWKAMARPLSDFAAMSGVPQFALITVVTPADSTLRWMTGLYRGLQKAARLFNISIVGGETSTTDGPVMISVSLLGWAERDRWVPRSGAQAGDELFVTGRLGGSLGGRHLSFTPRITESRWLTAHFDVHAMMDLSDGLGADLPRLALASGVDVELDESALPRNSRCTIKNAISDGEDYELLFAVARDEAALLQRRWRRRFPRLPLTRIGRFVKKRTSTQTKLPCGYVHFQ